MEVVEGLLVVGRQLVDGLVEADVLEAVPLEEDLAGPYVYLLDYPLEHGAVRTAPESR